MDAQSVLNYFRNFPLLQHLNQDELAQLSELAEYKSARKNSFIYLHDQPSNFLCLLVKGTVKTGLHGVDGREIIKSIQHPFTIFGELGLAGEQRRQEFAASLNVETGFIILKIQDVQKVMANNFAFSQAVMLYLGDRLRKAERQWESLILKDVRTRLVDFLKESAGARGRQVGYEMLVKHTLTQQDIANLVGASRQTVTAIMNDLKKNNLIHFNRTSILIRDMDKLS